MKEFTSSIHEINRIKRTELPTESNVSGGIFVKDKVRHF